MRTLLILALLVHFVVTQQSLTGDVTIGRNPCIESVCADDRCDFEYKPAGSRCFRIAGYEISFGECDESGRCSADPMLDVMMREYW